MDVQKTRKRWSHEAQRTSGRVTSILLLVDRSTQRPVGITTQDPVLRSRLNPDEAAERVYNFLHTLTMECQMMARACGKTNVHSLEPEDLAALTMEASALAMVPLAGTQHTVGRPDMTRY
jgi:hypothetical protein